MLFGTRLIVVMHTLLITLLISEFHVVVMGVHALLIILLKALLIMDMYTRNPITTQYNTITLTVIVAMSTL